MPLELKYAGKPFQRAKGIRIAPVEGQHALAYIYYVIKLFKSPGEHLRLVKSVLELILQAEVTLRLQKGNLFYNVINYLVHVITYKRLFITTRTIGVVHDLKYPTRSPWYCSFLELCSVFCKLASEFLSLAAPLIKRLKKAKHHKVWAKLQRNTDGARLGTNIKIDFCLNLAETQRTVCH